MQFYNEPTAVHGRARRRRARRSGSASGLIRGCLLLFTLLIVGTIVGTLIIAPVLFRGLPEQYQNGLARRVPILEAWLPTATVTSTRAYSADYLPTSDPSRANAGLDLLKTTDVPVITSTPGVIVTAAAPTQNVPKATAAGSGNSGNGGNTKPTAPASTLAAALPTSIPATDIPLPAAFHMTGYSWVPQTWNNCGPANLTQVLNGYGVKATQKDTAAWLKPNSNDQNVSPWQIVYYTNTFTHLKAVQRVNGNLTLLKKLMVAKFRPIIETGLLSPKDGQWEGHYLTPLGYDESQGILFGLDSLLGAGSDNLGVHENYADLDARWSHFNRVYIVVYPPEREGELSDILGNDADPVANAQGALAQAKREAQADPTNAYAWFNMGSSYVMLKDYRQAAAAYDQARSAGKGLPWRMLWYQFGPFVAYYNVGDYATASQLVEATLGTTHNIEEIYYWRGMIEAAQGKRDQALADLNSAFAYNPNYKPAADALAALKTGGTPVPPDVI